jgi:hypothetical protein
LPHDTDLSWHGPSPMPAQSAAFVFSRARSSIYGLVKLDADWTRNRSILAKPTCSAIPLPSNCSWQEFLWIRCLYYWAIPA